MKNFILLLILLFPSIVMADFISSKTSQIFHELDCRYASKLTEENSATYLTYQEAVDDGLRGCNVCEPEPDPDIPDPEPELDTNEISIILPKQASTIIPISGMVLQMDHCKYPYTARGVGKRIVVKEEFPITMEEALEQNFSKCLNFPAEDPNNPTEFVYVTHLSNFFHPKDCSHFVGHAVKMVNRNTEIIATNDATWYPESGILAWRVTPFEMGDYVAIANSDVGQTELGAISVRPNRLPTLEDAANTWLKGNFNMVKQAEFAAMFKKITGLINPISWVYENGRWIPVGNVGSNGIGRILTETVHEIINETTTRERTTKTYEIPFSTHSNVWEPTRIEVVETTIIQYTREGQDTPSSTVSIAGPGNRIEWIFENGAWKPIVNNSYVVENPYLDKYGEIDQDKLLEAKPVAPIRPDPDAVDEEEVKLKSMITEVPELKPLIEGLIASMPPRDTYEEKLIAYGAVYVEYEEELKAWQWTMDAIEENNEMEEMEDAHMHDRMDREHDEMMLLEEESKIIMLTELLDDSRITDEQKGTLREILNAIRENPVNENP